MSALRFDLIVPSHLCPEGLRVRMAGTEDDPLFCLADVCAALEAADPSAVAARIDDDEKQLVDLRELANTPSLARGNPRAWFVTEAGLYTVLLRSDKPLARDFRRWVTHDVIPSIRRFGCYPAPAEAADPLGAMMIESDRRWAMIRTMYETQREQARRLDHVERDASAALDAHRSGLGYFSVLGYARRHGWQMDLTEANAHGHRLSAVCRQRGIVIGSCPDQRFGKVNSYPETILDDYFRLQGRL